MVVKSNHGRANIFEASLALARQRDWIPEQCYGEEKILYSEFLMIMMCHGPSDCVRTINGFWKLYQEIGIARKVNQSKNMIFDLGKLRVLLASRYEEWKL